MRITLIAAADYSSICLDKSRSRLRLKGIFYIYIPILCIITYILLNYGYPITMYIYVAVRNVYGLLSDQNYTSRYGLYKPNYYTFKSKS